MSLYRWLYPTINAGALRSARALVPWLVGTLKPASVVDVGCGEGVWLSVFAENGVTDLLGIDGPHVDPERLLFPRERFLPANLDRPPAPPRRFDLVVSLETAEHLAPEAAERFVAFLTGLGDAVLFSAAIPGQGGILHVNERWPAYWVELFAARGFVPVGDVRARVWDLPGMDWWYAQNTMLLARPGATPLSVEDGGWSSRPLVHPRLFFLFAVTSPFAWAWFLFNLPARLLAAARRTRD